MAFDQIVVPADETAAARFTRDYATAYGLTDVSTVMVTFDAGTARRKFDVPHAREDAELNRQSAERLTRLYVVKPAGTTPADDNIIP